MQSAVSLLLYSNIFTQVIKWDTYSSVTFQLCTVLRTIERFNSNERERAGLISTHLTKHIHISNGNVFISILHYIYTIMNVNHRLDPRLWKDNKKLF